MASARSSIELTARGRILAALAGVSLLGAWLSADTTVRFAAALLAAPILVDLAGTCRSLKSLRLHVLPRRTVVGAPFHEEIRLSSTANQVVRELLVFEPHTRGVPTLLDQLRPGQHKSVRLACRSPSRSHLLERVFELQTNWPLGIFTAKATAIVAADFVTEPARVSLNPRLLHETSECEPAPHIRSNLPGDEFYSLREHQLTEDARGVHAMRSAAMGTLVRTILHGRLPRKVGIVLDLRRPPKRSLQIGIRRLEWSLGACATLLDRLRSSETIVHLWMIGSTTAQKIVQDGKSHRETLTFLAEAQASPHRQLEEDSLSGIDQMERCFWIPAGGYHAKSERTNTKTSVHMIDQGGQ